MENKFAGKRTHPFLMAQRWSQEAGKHPFKINSLSFHPFDAAQNQPTNKPHPWSLEASMEES